MQCYWNRTTETKLTELRAASDGVAVIPLASIESHGPHLPLGSDTHSIDYIVDQAIREETVAVLPTIQYSYVSSARVLPGAIHIKSDLLMEMVEQICDEIHRNGFTKIVLLHGHGGNLFLGDAFVKRMQEREKPFAIYTVPVLPGLWEKVGEVIESEEYGHACEFETSVNMVAAPELVDLDAIGDRTFPTSPRADIDCAKSSMEYLSQHPNMVVGEPRRAKKETGERIAKMWVDEVVRHLRLIKSDEVTMKVLKDYQKRAYTIGE